MVSCIDEPPGRTRHVVPCILESLREISQHSCLCPICTDWYLIRLRCGPGFGDFKIPPANFNGQTDRNHWNREPGKSLGSFFLFNHWFLLHFFFLSLNRNLFSSLTHIVKNMATPYLPTSHVMGSTPKRSLVSILHSSDKRLDWPIRDHIIIS